VPKSALFTNDSSSHTYQLQEIIQGQVVYFSIDPDYDFNVTLYNPSGTISEIERAIHQTKYLGAWITSISGNWKIQVDDTRPVKIENLTYSILVSIPPLGYNEIAAREVKSSILESSFRQQSEWNTFTERNRTKCSLGIKDNNLSTGTLPKSSAIPKRN
ncbi:MAG: hypothetical protein ACW991_01355, partial [Candidatus Hodarchaeales archaeon]